jgi:hypothetical protein
MPLSFNFKKISNEIELQGVVYSGGHEGLIVRFSKKCNINNLLHSFRNKPAVSYYSVKYNAASEQRWYEDGQPIREQYFRV